MSSSDHPVHDLRRPAVPARQFFIDFSFAAMGGNESSRPRCCAVVLPAWWPVGSASDHVTIGTVAYPLLAKAGYEKNAAGGLLSAGGLGAIISPPVLGAAAFLIAEFLKISYFDVILMATIPTILYYLAIWVMVEVDASKHGGTGDIMVEKGALWRLFVGYWFTLVRSSRSLPSCCSASRPCWLCSGQPCWP